MKKKQIIWAVVAACSVPLILAGCMSTGDPAKRGRNVRATCNGNGFEHGTWGIQYCVVQASYLQLVANGGGSSAGVSVALSIDNNRRRCIEQAAEHESVLDATFPTAEGPTTARRILAKISDKQEEEGKLPPEEIDRRINVLAEFFESEGLGFVREQCYRAAVEAYRVWGPVLIRTEQASASQDSDASSQINRQLKSIEASQRSMEQQQRNLQADIQNHHSRQENQRRACRLAGGVFCD